MQEQHLYEYAVIRIVPRVEREEFINAGIILFCKKSKHIACRFFLNEKKLMCFDDAIDLQVIQHNLTAFEMIVSASPKSSSAIARLDEASRFRWLTATRSTIIQCSKVHPGITNNMDATLEKLMKEMVL